MIGRPVREVLQLPEAFAASLTPTGEIGRSRRVDYTYTRTDGRRIEVGVSAAPLPLGQGQRGYIFTSQDVADQGPRARRRATAQQLVAVGEMAAGIARNPQSAGGDVGRHAGAARRSSAVARRRDSVDIVLRGSETA